MAAACLQGDVVRRLGKENLMTTIVPQLRLLTAVIGTSRTFRDVRPMSAIVGNPDIQPRTLDGRD